MKSFALALLVLFSALAAASAPSSRILAVPDFELPSGPLSAAGSRLLAHRSPPGAPFLLKPGPCPGSRAHRHARARPRLRLHSPFVVIPRVDVDPQMPIATPNPSIDYQLIVRQPGSAWFK